MQTPHETETPRRLLDALAARGHAVTATMAMAGDVSRRRYFRLALRAGGTAVLARYPDDLRLACRKSLATGRLLTAQGVRVPQVIDHDCDAGWVLLEDLGERTLFEQRERPWAELGLFFADAVRCIGRIATLPRAAVAALNPPLDRALLGRELEQTWEVFVEPMGFATGSAARDLWTALDEVCKRLTETGLVPCHRDLGARNLMPLEIAGACTVGVLDHQDLRLGPPDYDLASLLNDSLFPPPEVEEELLRLAGRSGPEERSTYHRAAVQRTLKAVGSYAAFARRGSDRHLPLIPPTLGCAVAHLGATPETSELAPRIEALWAPALAGEGLDRLRR